LRVGRTAEGLACMAADQGSAPLQVVCPKRGAGNGIGRLEVWKRGLSGRESQAWNGAPVCNILC
jgi:hypothetical protein